MMLQGVFQGNKWPMQFRVCNTNPHKASNGGKGNHMLSIAKLCLSSLCKFPLLGCESTQVNGNFSGD